MDSINRVLGVALWVVLVISALFAGVLLLCPVAFLSMLITMAISSSRAVRVATAAPRIPRAGAPSFPKMNTWCW